MLKDNFLADYNGHIFLDERTSCSKDFKSFAAKFKNFLKRNIPEGYSIVNHRCGHYDLSGFVKSPDGKCVYYSYAWDRFSPLNVYTDRSAMHGVLYRKAKDEKDFRGEINNFAAIADLPGSIVKLMSR